MMNPHELRQRFLTFFEERAHRVVASSPVIPKGDPTLMFANAGMNQFKDLLLGNEVRDYKRAASCQVCVRAGGKTNDLDEVGKDGRHLTFFEMLGNWSFGDYYKRESIRWGWDFATQVMGLDPARIYVSVHTSDEESYKIWREEVGVAEDHLIWLGDDSNFWSMGPVGPCGPCTEMHYDKHPALPWAFEGEFDGERYMEIWNHVFMEFNRAEDGTLNPLPMKSVDTGMGLERALVVMGGFDSVFKTGLFKGILEATAALLGLKLTQDEVLARPDQAAFCVIADHVRTITFAIAEGQPFSNTERGYVLRRILRRAVRHGRELGFTGPFLHTIAQVVIDEFSDVYPGLAPVAAQTREVIRLEEERFFRTIDRGVARFDEVAKRAQDGGAGVIDGEAAFMLYDTFGFPVDLTRIMAEELGLKVDEAGFEQALEAQRTRSSEQSRFYKDDAGPWITLRDGQSSDTFLGYTQLDADAQVVRYRAHDDGVEVLLTQTPFYAESGGQGGDRGTLRLGDGALLLEVIDTQRLPMGICHVCHVVDGFLTPQVMAEPVRASVNAALRQRTACNHTATHLLHAALHEVVSPDALQAGSLVNAQKLRFDFTYNKPLTLAQTRAIEDWVNAAILEAHPVTTHVDVPRQDAEKMGAMAIFGEKYGERVRVVEAVPGRSVELCGGTHVRNTSDILTFRIIQEGAIAAGTRRIEAVTQSTALEASRRDRALLEQATRASGADSAAQVPQRIERLTADLSALSKYADGLFLQLAKATAQRLTADGKVIGGVLTCASRVEVRDRAQLLKLADLVRDRLGDNGAALLGADLDGKPALVCVVSDPLAKRLKAGDLVNACAALIGGKGGGRPTLAQAGGHDLTQLDAAIAAFSPAVEAATSR
jgi:alanyl-tRNA synthetase